MRKLLIPLRKGLALFLATYFFFATLPLKSEPIAPLDKENVRLSLVVVSDVHTETNSLARFKVNMQSMKHFAAVKDTADALLLLGDNTMNGQKLENLFLYGMLEAVNPIKPYYTIVGNHDIGNVSEPDGSFPSFRETQLDYMRTFVDRSVEELYYSETVNGCHLIFMAPDTEECHERNFSDRQLDWLEAELQKAAADEKPIFVCSHHPLSYVVQGHDRFAQLVTQYPNTFLLVGHMHYYIHFGLIRGKYNTPEIWVPTLSMMENDGTPNDMSGFGYLTEVYDDEVVFRGVNFYEGKLTDTEQHYALQIPDDEPDLPLEPIPFTPIP